MKHCHNINFPELTFTSPGVYTFTVKELTPSDDEWITDPRTYRVVVTVERGEDGSLVASLDYPDGIPKFVNIYCPPPPPPPPGDVCKRFNKLPFPMLWFAPPQKPEFTELMRSSPYTLDWWDAP
ncbi:MAG: hypothetical protein LBE55_04165 [Clostridiales bacterium]|nr:hypothetical protein [Clostridiales bacterium]